MAAQQPRFTNLDKEELWFSHQSAATTSFERFGQVFKQLISISSKNHTFFTMT